MRKQKFRYKRSKAKLPGEVKIIDGKRVRVIPCVEPEYKPVFKNKFRPGEFKKRYGS